jgi:hypothetical protein
MTELETINEYLFKKYEKLIPASYGRGFVEYDKNNDNSINIITLISKYYEKENATYPRYYDIQEFYLLYIKKCYNKKKYFDETLKPLFKKFMIRKIRILLIYF